jgi:hypothetical protein
VPYTHVLEPGILPESLLQTFLKPCPGTFDSAHEFSLYRYLEVRRMVEAEDEELSGYVFDDSCLLIS